MSPELAARLQRGWQSFVTAGMGEGLSSAVLRRLKFQHLFALITVVALIAFGLVNLLSSHATASVRNGLVELAFALLGAVVLVYLRFSHRIDRAQSLSLLVTTAVMTFLLFEGGMDGTGHLWWFCLPAGAFFLKGRTRGWWWVGASFAVFLVATVAAANQWWPMPYSVVELRQLIAAYLVVSLLTWVYEAVRDDADRRLEAAAEALRRGNQRLEEEVCGHEQTQSLLEAARAEAERANRAKSEFLSRMSHELRTPMNSILGFAQLLESDPDEPLSPSQRESIKHVLRGGRDLLGLINEVLDLSRIESGKMMLHFEPVALSPLVDEVLATLQPLANARGIRLQGEGCSKPLPPVEADAGRLRQVLLNLVSNAIKYNRDFGLVVVDALRAGGGRLRITVADTGAGIPAERQATVFEPFQRLGAEGGSVEGTGIGLVIVKQLVLLMGGEVGFDSTPGLGSCFWVELAVASAGEPAVIPASPEFVPGSGAARQRGLVLYVEDDLSNLALVRHVLARRPGVELIHAARGADGVQMAAAHRPDLILLDMHLPDATGTEVLRRLREHAELADIPVVVVSASAMPSDVAEVEILGIARYLTKPLDVRAFLETVDALLDNRMQGEGS